MFTNLGRRAKFFLVKEEKRENIVPNEARIVPQIVPTSFDPDARRSRLNEFARLSQHTEKA